MRGFLLAVALLLTFASSPARADGSCVGANILVGGYEYCEEEESVLTDTEEAFVRACQEYGLQGGTQEAQIRCAYQDEDNWYWRFTYDLPNAM